ncbi:hypothetical protein ACHAWC_004328, partial [Mediolabrus comicus]
MYEQEKLEIGALKQYLLSQIPSTPLPPNNILLSSKSVALKAAVAGLDKELGRLEREERLVRKFTNENTVYHGTGTTVGSSAAASASHASSSNYKNDNADEDVAMEYVKMSKEDAENDTTTTTTTTAMKRENNDDEEDWEEAEASPLSKKKPSLTESQDLREQIATKWASSTISHIAKVDARAETPVGALGLALHTALVELTSSVNGSNKKMEQMFRCTGVPDESIVLQFLGEDKKKESGGGGGMGGFAPSIRELPKGVLVPPKWRGDSNLIAFRYKCGQDVYTTTSGPTNDSATLYLVLQVQDSTTVKVSFGPMPATKGTLQSNQLQFPLTQHINLDGFHASKSKSCALVQPSLFFISLPNLLLQFGTTFGCISPTFGTTFGLISAMQYTFGGGPVAAVVEEGVVVDTDMDTANPMNTNTQPAAWYPGLGIQNGDGPAVELPGRDSTTSNDPLRIMDSRNTGTVGRRGDFEGDLLPGGPQPGHLPDNVGTPSFGGSQVGPNHPMFDRTFGDDGDDMMYQGGVGFGPPNFGIPGVGGGDMGMRPRFDPFGPPGGPTEPGRGGGRGGGR